MNMLGAQQGRLTRVPGKRLFVSIAIGPGVSLKALCSKKFVGAKHSHDSLGWLTDFVRLRLDLTCT